MCSCYFLVMLTYLVPVCVGADDGHMPSLHRSFPAIVGPLLLAVGWRRTFLYFAVAVFSIGTVAMWASEVKLHAGPPA